jgi:hypothetical protein
MRNLYLKTYEVGTASDGITSIPNFIKIHSVILELKCTATERISLEFVHIMHIRKSSPVTRHGGAWGERRYSSYSFTTSALDGGE